MEAREDSGMPFSYFPVMMPQASGDHVIAPTPVTTETTGVKTKAVLVPCVEGRGAKNTTGWWKCTRSLWATEDDHISSSYLWQTEHNNFLTICFTLGQDILSSGKDLHTHTLNTCLSCGKVQAVELRLFPSGRDDTLPAHTQEGWD